MRSGCPNLGGVDHVDLRIAGRITPASLGGFRAPLEAAVDAGRPFTVLYDRREVGAPTAEGRAALYAFYERWDEVAALVVAWADVWDPRRERSLRRAAQARAEAGRERPRPPYPHAAFACVDEARSWLRAVRVPA